MPISKTAEKIILAGSFLLVFTSLSFSQPANLYSFSSGYVDLGVDYTTFLSSGGHYVGVRGETVYVVTAGGWTWCAKSTDGGKTFGVPVKVNSTLSGYNPSMRVDTAGVVYVAYQDENADIRFTKSTDGGLSFIPAIKVNDDTIPEVGQEKPAIAVNNKGQIFIAWNDQRTAPGQPHKAIFASASFDSGLTFTPNVQVNDTNEWAGVGDIAADDNGRVYVLYQGQIIARSMNSGQSFSSRTYIAEPPWYLGFSSMAICGPKIGIVGGAAKFVSDTLEVVLRFSVSQDYGQTFSPSVRVDDDSDLSSSTSPQTPSLAWKRGMFYVAWRDPNPLITPFVDRIAFSYSSNLGQSFVPSVAVNSFNSAHAFPGLIVSDTGKAFVAWLDNRFDPRFGEDYHTVVATGIQNPVKGDLNLDSSLTAVDIVLHLNATFSGQAFPAPYPTADLNCDGELTPTDLVLELRLVFNESPPPCS